MQMEPIKANLRRFARVFGAIILLGPCISAAQNCGSLDNPYGPFNYRTQAEQLKVVEHFHFSSDVANLRRGTTGSVGQDLDYTLRASPNHPKALIAMIRLGEKLKTETPSGSRYSIECWLDRAVRFSPEDAIVRMIFADYLTKRNRKTEALHQIEKVIENGVDNPMSHYNLGMLLADLGEYDRALEQAHIALEMGVQQSALRDRLKAAGKWQDPPSAANTTEQQKLPE